MVTINTIVQYVIFFMGFVLACFGVHGQNYQAIDSLASTLKTTAPDTQKVKVLLDMAYEYQLVKSDSAELYCQKALTLAQKSGYANGTGASHKSLGVYYFYKGQYNEALASFNNAIAIFTQTYNKKELSESYRKIGLVYAYKDAFDLGIANYEKSLQLATELGNKKAQADCLNDIGVLYNYKGDHQTSIDYQQKSLTICRELNDKKAISSRLLNLGTAFADQSQFQTAIDYYLEALTLKIEIGDQRGTSMCYNNLGEVYKNRGDYIDAIDFYEKSLKIDQQLDDREGLAICLMNIGTMHSLLGNKNKAREYYEQSVKLAQDNGFKRIMAEVSLLLGNLYIEDQQFDSALKQFNLSYQLSMETGDRNKEAEAFYYLGQVNLLQGNYEAAITKLQAAYNLHTQLGEQAEAATDIIKLGKAVEKTGDIIKAIELYQNGLQIAKKIGSKVNVKLAAESLSEAYFSRGDYKQAYIYHVLFKTTHDSIYSIESKTQLAQVESRFELERKQQQIELQKSTLDRQEIELKQQKTKQAALWAILCAGLAVVFIMIFSYLKLNKANAIITQQMVQIQEANEELNQKNEELHVTLETVREQQSLIENKNKEITSSMTYARNIQRAIMPGIDKLSGVFQHHFLYNRPKQIISGDFYWVNQLSNKTIVAVADCTGHGVPGAFMSMLGVSLLNEVVLKEGHLGVDYILEQLRQDIIQALHQQGEIGEQREGMEMALCSIDKANMTLEFAGANLPIYIIRSKNLQPIPGATSTSTNQFVLYELKGNKMPVAIHLKMDLFEYHRVELMAGDQLYLFTDGFADQFGGPDHRRYQYSQFKQLLLANCQLPMDSQRCALNEAFNQWQKGHDQIDDVLVLGITVS